MCHSETHCFGLMPLTSDIDSTYDSICGEIQVGTHFLVEFETVLVVIGTLTCDDHVFFLCGCWFFLTDTATEMRKILGNILPSKL